MITIAIKVVIITVALIFVGLTVTLRRIVLKNDVTMRSSLFPESTLIWTKYSGSGDGAHGSEVDQHAIP